MNPWIYGGMGPEGPQGAPGDRGPPGPTGATGPAGPNVTRAFDSFYTDQTPQVEADGWVVVLSVSLATFGDRDVEIDGRFSPSDIDVGGEVRVRITDGAGLDEAFVARRVVALPDTEVSQFVRQAVSAGAGTTYTIELQARAVGGGASLIPGAGSLSAKAFA